MLTMKKLFLASLVLGLFACQSADQNNGQELSQSDKETAVRDSANFTTIEWIDSTFQDLGKIKPGQIVEVSYRFKNTGSKNLVIANVSASCGCTIPERPEKPIAPGEEGVIRAKFDSNGRGKGENRKSVTVRANTDPGETHLSFRVEIID